MPLYCFLSELRCCVFLLEFLVLFLIAMLSCWYMMLQPTILLFIEGSYAKLFIQYIDNAERAYLSTSITSKRIVNSWVES